MLRKYNYVIQIFNWIVAIAGVSCAYLWLFNDCDLIYLLGWGVAAYLCVIGCSLACYYSS